ncbi:MAG: hypothetical protein MJZ28_03550 [Paludibacteraceae bacterium]|nr:hypothetical protein [Paludibacteraceae bacterium]
MKIHHYCLGLLLLASCTGNQNVNNAPQTSNAGSIAIDSVTATTPTAEEAKEEEIKLPVDKDIAFEVYQLINKKDLPDLFKDIKREDSELTNFMNLSKFIALGECDYHSFNLQCYAVEDGSFKVYWTYENGCDGSVVLQKAAYTYKDGNLKKCDFDLYPSMKDAIKPENYAQEDWDKLCQTTEVTNPLYRFTSHTELLICINSDAETEGYVCKYKWNGKSFEKEE